jgi:predicted lysophospholipase L1 biosynthesis ABC-type transport system permease subunit
VYLLVAVLSHETLGADVGEKEALVDGDVGGVLVGGGVGGSLIEVSFPTYVGIAALLLVVSLLLLLLPLLVLVSVTFTRHWTFSNKVTGLTTPVAHLLRAGLVVLPSPMLEDLAEVPDDERHFLFVELGGVDWKPTWCRLLLLFFRRFECDGLHLGCGGGALLQVEQCV